MPATRGTRIATAALPLLLMQLPATANATSCVRITTWIYGSCTEGRCSDPLFIDTESGYGYCGRLPLVRDGSDVHRDMLELKARTTGETGNGVYEMELTRDWYYPGYRLESLEDYVHHHERSQRGSSSTAFRRIEGESIDEIRARWTAERTDQIKRDNREKAVDAALYFPGTVSLALSLFFFIRWNKDLARRRSLIAAAALQGGTAAYGFLLITDVRHDIIGATLMIVALALMILEVAFALCRDTYRLIRTRL